MSGRSRSTKVDNVVSTIGDYLLVITRFVDTRDRNICRSDPVHCFFLITYLEYSIICYSDLTRLLPVPLLMTRHTLSVGDL